MRFTILGIEVVIHRKEDRPQWYRKTKWHRKKDKPVVNRQKLADAVVNYACYINDVVTDDLQTGCRYGDLPDTRKLISRTLHEVGMGENMIRDLAGSYLGTRDTIHAQIAASRLMDNHTHRDFSKKLDMMRKQFVDNSGKQFVE